MRAGGGLRSLAALVLVLSAWLSTSDEVRSRTQARLDETTTQMTARWLRVYCREIFEFCIVTNDGRVVVEWTPADNRQ